MSRILLTTCQKTQNLLLQNITNNVTQEQNKQLTKLPSKNEIQEVVLQMKDQKSPGIDRIPLEFYKENYKLLEEDLYQLYINIIFNEKKLTKTMKQAIIKLIPKKSDDLEDLKNWRPISLLCIDYKILTKILFNRLKKKKLPDIISEEQNCSIPQRNIFNNLFLIRDVIRYNKEKAHLFIYYKLTKTKPLIKLTKTFSTKQ